MNNLNIYCIYHNDSQIFEYNLSNIPDYIKLFNVKQENENSINNLNKYLCELCAYYYFWKNQIYSKYIGFCHYRRFYRYIDIDNLKKYNVHYYGYIVKSINELYNEYFFTKEDINLLYEYLVSLNIFDNNYLHKCFFTDYKMNIPWKLSYIFEWNLFNKFCKLTFGFLEHIFPNYKNIDSYNNIDRLYAWKFEIVCGIILCLLTNNIELNNTNWSYNSFYNRVLLTKSDNLDQIKLWARKNNRTCTSLYVLSDIENKDLFNEEGLKLIKNVNEISQYENIIQLNINQYIKCKEPNDFYNNNFTIKNIL